jgi:hypothetical protein
MIKIHEMKKKENITTKSLTQLIAHFKNIIHKIIEKIMTAYKLLLKDVILIMMFSASKQELKRNDD